MHCKTYLAKLKASSIKLDLSSAVKTYKKILNVILVFTPLKVKLLSMTITEFSKLEVLTASQKDFLAFCKSIKRAKVITDLKAKLD